MEKSTWFRLEPARLPMERKAVEKEKKEGKETRAKDGAEPLAVEWEVWKQWNGSHRARSNLTIFPSIRET